MYLDRTCNTSMVYY